MSGSEAAGIRRRPIAVVAIAVATAAIPAIGLATPRCVAAGSEAAPSPQATGYLPSISDLMIATKDGTAFSKVYADLTDACNSCHQAFNHGVVEIHVPNRTSASD